MSCQILGRDNDIHIYNYYISKGSLHQTRDWEQSFDKNNKNVIITGDFNLKHPEGDFRSGQTTRIADKHDQLESAID